ncbi:glycosyltransferase family 4 protein [Paraburkholderia sp. CI3]|uniref:glycosyltransferase family 4 protein n=1 Tax=Paraburkholderia sp. CI3 TaxID=2991060 RepID=UPI003D2251B6
MNVFIAKQTSLIKLLPVTAARRLVQQGEARKSALSLRSRRKQILVDVSVIVQNDARTGIQRVVRALLMQLLSAPPFGYRICPVFCTRNQDYCYAPDFLQLDANTGLALERVTVEQGDIFLGLDLVAHLMPRQHAQLVAWKNSGLTIHVVIYDLLPLKYPNWFNPKTSRNFRRWMRTVAVFADSAICISNAVGAELTEWLAIRYGISKEMLPIKSFLLGADIEASLPSRGLPDGSTHLLERLKDKPSVLMVGTLEPRKGHSQALAAFEQLWQRGQDVNLVIVGKPGWKIESLQQRLLNHPLNSTRLHWLQNISDEMLKRLYEVCLGVLIASEAEGFGLPVIEAAYYAKPVLARDLPVFREIAGETITYFSGSTAESLSSVLVKWLENPLSGQGRSAAISAPSWKSAARELLACLELPPDSVLHSDMSEL